MIDWNTYGSVIRIYKGSGSLCFGEDKESCEFELVQLANGDLYALCQVSDHVTALSMSFNKELEKLVGEIGDDQILIFSDNMIIKSVIENQLIVYGKFISVKSLNHKSARFRFALTNLVMDEKRVQLNCDGINLTIRRVENYDDIVFALKASKGIAVTCEAVIDSNSTIARETVVNTVNDVCLLLTLSQGCRVTWLYYDVVKSNDEIIESFHGSAITKPFTSLPLIAAQDMVGFLERVYPNLTCRARRSSGRFKRPWMLILTRKLRGIFLKPVPLSW